MQLLTIDRLGEITSRTECHTAALLIQDGDHDDRDLGEFAILSQCCKYGPSVEIGHYHIESNHTGVYFLGELEPLQSARRSHDRKSFGPELIRKQFARSRIVVYNEDAITIRPAAALREGPCRNVGAARHANSED